jgi:RIO kinase 1
MTKKSNKEIDKKICRIDFEIDKLRTKKKDSDYLKVEENVFDVATLKALYTLSNKGFLHSLGGSISTGKEANLFYGIGEVEDERRPIAIKIYRITTSTFNSMEKYLLGDARFKNIRHNKKDIIFEWTKKEYRNLLRAEKAGLRVPNPITTERNILIMSFMGIDEVPHPLLKEVKFNNAKAQEIFYIIIDYMRKLYKDANLVHGDLSEYNIMIDMQDISPIIIDVGQSVLIEHPNANYFLQRDIKNILNFFKRYKITMTNDELYSFITVN